MKFSGGAHPHFGFGQGIEPCVLLSIAIDLVLTPFVIIF